MDALDKKLNQHFDGKVVRKDLLHRIKKGTTGRGQFQLCRARSSRHRQVLFLQ